MKVHWHPWADCDNNSVNAFPEIVKESQWNRKWAFIIDNAMMALFEKNEVAIVTIMNEIIAQRRRRLENS